MDIQKRALPCNIEAEKVILGNLIMWPERIPEAIIQISPTEFYLDKHKTIFEALITMDLAKCHIDLVSASNYLGGRIESGYLSSLLDGLIKVKKESFINHLQSIKEKAQLRDIINKSYLVYETAFRGDIGETKESLLDLKAHTDGTAKTLAEKTEEWVTLTEGYFSVSDCQGALGIISERDRNNLRQIIYGMKKRGIIEPYGNRAGVYRRVQDEIEVIDWKSAGEEEFPVELPFDLSKLVYVFPKSILVIAGNFNAGKTAFCLETIRLNMGKFKVNYFTSEMGPTKLKQRLKKFNNVEFPDGWNFNAIYRARNWEDAIKQFPDDINIIDYMEVGDSFWLVGQYIDNIFNRLNNGIAIICLQKIYGRDLGVGGDWSARKASLYLSVDPGVLKIIKAKEWRGETNPNRKYKKFKLVQGWNFIPDEEWSDEDADAALKEYDKSRKRMFKT